jgi:GNAT superfamily N-acetyltransferase
MQDFLIRPATRADVPLILAFIRELAAYERLSPQVVATEEILAASLFDGHPAAEVLLAHCGEAPAGFAAYFHNFSTFLGRWGLYLEDLYVKPDFRGRGCGEALLRRVAQVACARGCGRLEWAALDWNQTAIRFYGKLGAVALNDWTIFRVTGAALERLATTK